MMMSEYRKDKQRLSNKQQKCKEMEILIKKKYMITKVRNYYFFSLDFLSKI